MRNSSVSWQARRAQNRSETAILIAPLVLVILTGWAAHAQPSQPSEAFAAKKSAVVLQLDPGGNVFQYRDRWREIAQSGEDVEIRGPCLSACTLIMGYVPKERLCFGDYASLQFHAAREGASGKLSERATWDVFRSYPNDIREWLKGRGGVPKMTAAFWELGAKELWVMGYRRCEPNLAPPASRQPVKCLKPDGTEESCASRQCEWRGCHGRLAVDVQ
jgi:hypothetical protein